MAKGSIELEGGLSLKIGMRYEIIRTEDPARGLFKVKTHAYEYSLRDQDQELLIAYHWHPTGESSYHEPHIHVPAILTGRIHFPSERVSLERVVRFCIRELGAEPRREDWESVLTMNEDLFETYRTWPQPPRVAPQAQP